MSESPESRSSPPSPQTGQGRERLTWMQWAMVTLGVAGIGWGLWQLVVVAPSATRPLDAVLWLAGGLAVHDAVLAPLAVMVAAVLVRTLSGRGRRAVAVLLFVLVALVLVALPGWFGPA